MSHSCLAIGLAGALLAGEMRTAEACGCFTPPDPTVPVVQAGERILFALEDGQVTSHVQIQYQGDAAEFGWILPLPSIPTLELGTDEVFNTLIAQTQPKYRLTRKYEGNCDFGPNGRGGFASPQAAGSSEDANGTVDNYNPLVIKDSIGPYDYAVLKADRKDEMLKWLADNRYFVPVGTDDAVGPYIHAGAYFLALKLRSGQSAGDLQPVVVKYPSDLPMIPLVLTSVAANPNMGIQVWMLGAGRAIPRNYYHTIINDAFIDWNTGGQNYNDVIIGAVTEAPEKHSFVTEFAGSVASAGIDLAPPNRFGSIQQLATMPTAVDFVNYLNSHNYTYTSQLLAVLQKYIPVPPGFTTQNIGGGNQSPAITFYQNLDYYLSPMFQAQNPSYFAGWPGVDYKPAEMAMQIEERVVKPTQAAAALFAAHPYLTRLYSTLSPEDMNKDPVFSYNASLPDYSNVHEGTLTYYCGFWGSGSAASTPARLVTAQGYIIDFPNGTGQNLPIAATAGVAPYSSRIEILREEGEPEVLTNNEDLIRQQLPRSGGGCAMDARAGRDAARAAVLFGLLGVALVITLRRRV